jgi:hypothetical protein
MTVPETVAVSICAKLSTPMSIQQRTRKQERVEWAGLAVDSGHKLSLVIDWLPSAPSIHRQLTFIPNLHEKILEE